MSVLKSYLESSEVVKLISSLSPMATPIDGRPPASAIRGLFLLAYPLLLLKRCSREPNLVLMR